MKKIIIILLGIFAAAPAFSITADEIVLKADDSRVVSPDFEMEINVQDYKNGKLSGTASFKGFVKGFLKSMVAYTGPENMKGRKILMVADDMWVFIPGTQKPVRLTASQRLIGQASNGDVVKVRFSYDYSAELAGEENIIDIDSHTRNCYRLELSSKRSGAAYSKLTLWAEKETFYPVKAEFFALSGKKLKTAFYSLIKEFEGKKVISKATIFDQIIRSNYTTVEDTGMKKAEVPDIYFNKQYLQRM